MDQQWYVWNAQQHSATGPMDQSTLRMMIEDGLVQPDTLVRSTDMSEWLRADQSALNPAARASPPPPPPPPPAAPEAHAPAQAYREPEHHGPESYAPQPRLPQPSHPQPRRPHHPQPQSRRDPAQAFPGTPKRKGKGAAIALWAVVLVIGMALPYFLLFSGAMDEGQADDEVTSRTKSGNGDDRVLHVGPAVPDQSRESGTWPSSRTDTNDDSAKLEARRQRLREEAEAEQARIRAEAAAERRKKADERRAAAEEEAEAQAERERQAAEARRKKEAEAAKLAEQERLKREQEEAERLAEKARIAQEKADKRWEKLAQSNSFIRRRRQSSVKHPHQERVDAALLWLAHHQSEDGRFDANAFDKEAEREATSTGNTDFAKRLKSDKGLPEGNVGLTSLALLAFAGEGHTIRPSDHRDVARKGLDWLLDQQDEEGCFGPREGDEFVYNHAIATMAICEHLALSLDDDLRAPAQLAVDFIVKAQNPELAWRYGVQAGENDTSITTWMVLALHTAEIAGLEFPAEVVYEGANNWIDLVVSTDYRTNITSAGYRDPGSSNARLASTDHYLRNAAMDCSAILCRVFTGKAEHNDGQLVKPLLDRTVADPPVWRDESATIYPEQKIDFYYWHAASLATYQVGDDWWEDWERDCIEQVLLPHQRGWHEDDVEAFGVGIMAGGTGKRAGCWMLQEHGSWDPVGAWGSIGGRVYSTCMGALILQAPYRYERQD